MMEKEPRQERTFVLDADDMQLVVEALAPTGADPAYSPIWRAQRDALRQRIREILNAR